MDKTQKINFDGDVKYYFGRRFSVPVDFDKAEYDYPLLWYIEASYTQILEGGIFFFAWLFLWDPFKSYMKRLKDKLYELLGLVAYPEDPFDYNPLRLEAVLGAISEDDHMLQYGLALTLPTKFDIKANKGYDGFYRKLRRYSKETGFKFKEDYT
jgi:hypothetical protein